MSAPRNFFIMLECRDGIISGCGSLIESTPNHSYIQTPFQLPELNLNEYFAARNMSVQLKDFSRVWGSGDYKQYKHWWYPWVEVYQHNSYKIDAGDVRLTFDVKELDTPERPYPKHGHLNNVAGQWYQNMDSPYNCELCQYGQRHQTPNGWKHTLSIKVIV